MVGNPNIGVLTNSIITKMEMIKNIKPKKTKPNTKLNSKSMLSIVTKSYSFNNVLTSPKSLEKYLSTTASLSSYSQLFQVLSQLYPLNQDVLKNNPTPTELFNKFIYINSMFLNITSCKMNSTCIIKIS